VGDLEIQSLYRGAGYHSNRSDPRGAVAEEYDTRSQGQAGSSYRYEEYRPHFFRRSQQRRMGQRANPQARSTKVVQSRRLIIHQRFSLIFFSPQKSNHEYF